MFENLMMGFSISMTWENLAFCLAGCVLGTIVGILPGLGPAATIAMLITLTYKLNVISAIIMLAGVYYGAQYGGTLTSVLLKIPGEASTIVTIFDGHKMALKGQAGKALGIAALASFIAGTFGTLMLGLLSPPLSEFALMFGSPEYVALMIMGLTLVMFLGKGSKIKSFLLGSVGLALGTIGMDPATAYERFTFGSAWLMEGISLPIMAMGLFGIGEILHLAESVAVRDARDAIKCPEKLKDLLPNKKDIKASAMPMARGSVVGFLLGVIPGGGAIISTFASYALEKKLSKHPEKFGTGIIEGVAGPEAANNAAATGAFVPLLTLGIPSTVVSALLLAGFMVHGVIPGPLIMKNNPEIFWAIVTSMYIGNVMLVILNVPLIKYFVKILEVPFSILSPMITMICLLGAFSIKNSTFDLTSLLVFGIIGYTLRKCNYSPAPLMLAYILGRRLERGIRQSLIISQGSFLIFFHSKICIVLLGLTLLMIFSPLLLKLFSFKKVSLKRKFQ